MFNAPEQFTEINKATMDAVVQAAHISFETAERLVNLHLAASKEAFSELTKNLKTVGDVKDPQELIAIRGKLAETGVDRLVSYSRSLYELTTQAQSQISALVEERFGELNKSVVAAIDKAVKSAPAGADVAVAAIKSSVAATAAAIDGVTKAAKQVAEFTDVGVKATASAATSAVKAAKAK